MPANDFEVIDKFSDEVPTFVLRIGGRNMFQCCNFRHIVPLYGTPIGQDLDSNQSLAQPATPCECRQQCNAMLPEYVVHTDEDLWQATPSSLNRIRPLSRSDTFRAGLRPALRDRSVQGDSTVSSPPREARMSLIWARSQDDTAHGR